jgi:hypothetical protein
VPFSNVPSQFSSVFQLLHLGTQAPDTQTGTCGAKVLHHGVPRVGVQGIIHQKLSQRFRGRWAMAKTSRWRLTGTLVHGPGCALAFRGAVKRLFAPPTLLGRGSCAHVTH